MSDTPSCGRFVWYDLMSTDPERSARFYGDLLKWGARPVDMGRAGTYTMLHTRAGKDVGGVVPLDGTQGVPSHWIAYVSVPDVDAAVSKVTGLGGQVPVGPTDIPGVGRFAVVLDPGGAAISPFQSARGGEGEGDMTSGPGTFCWNELLARDPEKAAAFYVGIFDWSAQSQEMGSTGTYWLFYRGEEWAAGMMPMPAEAPGPQQWLPYIEVEDVKESAAHAMELGAAMQVEPRDIPNVGRFSVLTDPTGALFALFTGLKA